MNWPPHREFLSRGGNTYTRLALGDPGPRRHRRLPRLPPHGAASLDLDDVASQGYCFQVDLAWRAVQRGLRVVEVPITFVERERGESKMSGSIVRESLTRVTRWGIRHRAHQLRALAAGPAKPGSRCPVSRLRPRQVSAGAARVRSSSSLVEIAVAVLVAQVIGPWLTDVS